MFGVPRNMSSTGYKFTPEGSVPSRSSYLGYFGSIVILIVAIILFIHYFITPIFQLNPGGPGVIPLPGMNDSKTYWKTLIHDPSLPDTSTILGTQTSNWSMTLDLFIEQPFVPSQYPRLLFGRGGIMNETPFSNTISGLLQSYNICMALEAETTNLIVSTLNVDELSEEVHVPNVPIQTPFRVGVVLMDQVMEVYINGMLFKTRALTAPPIQAHGAFRPPSGDMASLAKVLNLTIWKRAVSASEIRYAKPPLASAKDFDPSNMNGGGTCPTSLFDKVDSITGGVSALANSVPSIANSVSSLANSVQPLGNA